MANYTKIEWCDATINPITGCLHKCPYCYARRITTRFSGRKYDMGGIHKLCTPIFSKDKIKPYPYGFEPTFHEYNMIKYERLLQKFESQGGKTVFVGSMTDMFGRWVPYKWLDEIFDLLSKHPKNRYLFLTKNPAAYKEYDVPDKPCFWYGTTITGSGYGLQNGIDAIEAVAPYQNFISMEPLLDYIPIPYDAFTAIDWLIIGAETGNRKGKVIPKKEWLDIYVEKCDDANVPVFMKDSLIPVVGEENMERHFPWK